MFRKTFSYLIVGLGNPGLQYEKTRHNAGFLCIDEIVRQYGAASFKNKFHALVAEATIGGARCLLCKPQTYMNNSGTAVQEIARFYKIAPKNILVLFDDTSLAVGHLRIRRNGTHGGHNGIKDIIELLGTSEIPRLKIGIGQKPHPDFDLKDWVLGKFSAEEWESLQVALQNAAAAVGCIIEDSIDTAMNRYNG
ncbi:MAG: aminoacyl-tRNA hydrolase [Clostridia bacterium]|nr:aminoacyl-tRNA hydrolase [Clostridia bacterium]